MMASACVESFPFKFRSIFMMKFLFLEPVHLYFLSNDEDVIPEEWYSVCVA
jgi:hypothetical protein